MAEKKKRTKRSKQDSDDDDTPLLKSAKKKKEDVPHKTVSIIENEQPSTIFDENDKHTQYGGRKYRFEVAIDDREICPGVSEYLMSQAKKKNINLVVTRKRLTVGDYLVCADGHAVAIRERKRIDDFFASIYDGRYKCQMQNMKITGIPLQGYVFTRTANEKDSRESFMNMLFDENSNADELKNFINSQYHIIPRHSRYDRESGTRVPLDNDELQAYYTAMAMHNKGTELVSDEFLPQYLWAVLKEVMEYVKVRDVTELPPQLFIEQKMGKRQIDSPKSCLQASLQTFCPDATAAFLINHYSSLSDLQADLKKNNDELYLHKTFSKFVTPTISKKIFHFYL